MHSAQIQLLFGYAIRGVVCQHLSFQAFMNSSIHPYGLANNVVCQPGLDPLE